MNVAIGAEYRMELYEIFAGQEESWATYDINGEIWDGDLATQATDFFGRARPGGIQYSLVLDLRMKETQQEIVMHFMQMLSRPYRKRDALWSSSF